jgi:AP-4 complex subunit mu-1
MVVASRSNFSPTYVVDLLMRLANIVKDFCGAISEELIRKNFILVYEVIDEMIDYGYAQSVSTDQVRPFIVNEPILTESSRLSFKPNFFSPSTAPSTSSNRSVLPSNPKKAKNEIFVDLYEKITTLFNSSGFVIN